MVNECSRDRPYYGLLTSIEDQQARGDLALFGFYNGIRKVGEILQTRESFIAQEMSETTIDTLVEVLRTKYQLELPKSPDKVDEGTLETQVQSNTFKENKPIVEQLENKVAYDIVRNPNYLLVAGVRINPKGNETLDILSKMFELYRRYGDITQVANEMGGLKYAHVRKRLLQAGVVKKMEKKEVEGNGEPRKKIVSGGAAPRGLFEETPF